MSKFTKGPWRLDQYENILDANDRKVVVTGVALSMSGIDSEVSANARLISAAPDLLEALERYVHAIAVGGGSDKDLIMDAIRQADNKARAAIAKAKGEA